MAADADKPLRIGFWGAGTWARMVADRIKDMPELTVAACLDDSEASAAAMGEATGCRIMRDAESLLDRSLLDAVVVVTPNDLHAKHAVRVLEAGLHVFIEKPMANSVGECVQVLEAAKRSGSMLMVGHNTRREPRYRHVRKMMTTGELGTIVAANMIFSSPAGLMQPAGSWRMDPERCVALVVSQLGVHLFDTFNYLFGRPHGVQALIRSIAVLDGVDDLCCGTLDYENGLCANFTICYSTANRRALEVLGTKGSIYTDESKTMFRAADGSREPEELTFSPADTVREEFVEFVRCCRSGGRPETDGLAGMASVAVMEKVLAASREQRRQVFDWSRFASNEDSTKNADLEVAVHEPGA